eukprot:scaffold5988_cov381-Prasinococcus_capsulatus_cf.AAC.6
MAPALAFAELVAHARTHASGEAPALRRRAARGVRPRLDTCMHVSCKPGLAACRVATPSSAAR